MLTKAIVSLCIIVLATGCISTSYQNRDEDSNQQSQEQIQKMRAERKRILSLMAQGLADARIAELKPQLDLTSEEESAVRKAFIQKFQQLTDDLAAAFERLLRGEPPPPSPVEPYHLQTDRELLEPLLTPRQMATYDAFKAKQRKDQAAKTAASRLDRIDSALGLNDQQRNQIREIFTASAEQQIEASDNCNLAALPDRGLETEKLEGVMTPEQFKRYEELSSPPQRQADADKSSFWRLLGGGAAAENIFHRVY